MMGIDYLWITLGSIKWYHFFLNVMHFILKLDVWMEH